MLADTSVIQLGTKGSVAGRGFAVVGCLVRTWEGGQWFEWYLRRDDARTAWLADAAGELSLFDEQDVSRFSAPAKLSQLGERVAIGEQPYVVIDIKRAEVQRIDGRLPQSIVPGQVSTCVDLDGVAGRCATVETADDGIRLLYMGRYTNAEALQLSNLRMPAGWRKP